MIIDSPIISGSYSASGSLNQFGNVVISGSLTVTGSIIGTASFASTASYLSGYVSPFPFTGSAIISGSLDVTGSLKVTGSITSTGTLTAQTLVVQTVSSSVIYSSGSNVFGNDLANTQRLTGSVSITGSLAVNGSNAILTNQTSSMSASYAVSASYASTSTSASFATSASSAVTASYWSGSINNVLSASYALTASYSANVPVTASYANNANSASYASTASFATTASYLSGYVSPFPFTGSAIISGSLTVTGSLNASGSGTMFALNADVLEVTGSVIATSGFTGSLFGTASYWSGSITNAATASFVQTAQTASFVQTAQTASFVTTAQTASYVLNAVSSSFATSASQALTASYLSGYVSPFPFTGSAVISGSLGVTGSFKVTNLSGSGVRYLVADESGSVTAQSASAALKSTQAFTSTAGQTTFSVTNGYATGYVDVFINGSKLNSTEFTDTSGTNIVLATGSFSGDTVEVVKYTPALGVTNNVLRQLTTLTGSAGQTVFSASYTPGLLDIFYNGSRLSPADFTANNGTFFTLATGSAANDILDVLVYSYQVGAFSGIGGAGVVNQLAFFNTTSSITGSDSFTVSGNTLVGTASYASNADLLDGAHLSILATTGSNTFKSSQYISSSFTPVGFTDTASLYTDGGIRATKNSYFSSSVYVGGDLIIFGSQSVNYITSSQLNIADNIITVNTSTPALRFGGIAVIDSGSLASGLTGSLLWDSQTNNWIYSNPSGSGNYDSAMVMMGPQNSGALGSEVGLTFNAIPKGAGGHHMTSSGIFESGSNVGIGTSVPTNTLHILGTSDQQLKIDVNAAGTYSSINFARTGSNVGAVAYSHATNTWQLPYTNGTNDNIVMYAGGAERVRIDSTGSVGIGTSTPTTRCLTLYGTSDTKRGISFRGPAGSGGNIFLEGYDSDDNEYSNFEFVANSGGGYFVFNSATGTNPNSWTTNARMVIGSNGRVGIGTSSPSANLHVDANSGLLTKEILLVKGGGSPSGNYGFSVQANNGDKIFYTDNLTYNVIGGLNGGKFGIGTTSPGQLLTVKHPSSHTYMQLDTTGSSLAAWILYSAGAANKWLVGLEGSSDNYYMYNTVGTAGYRLTLTQAGVLSTTGGGTSDRRTKKDIINITENVLPFINELKPVSFKFIEDIDENTRRGFIAQDVLETSIPSLVLGDGELEGGTYGLDYDGILALTVKALQEANAKITSLEEKLERNNIN